MVSQWCEGNSDVSGQTRIFDFPHTTIEHIYPQSAKSSEKVAALERVKHTLGNLTILGPNDNDVAANTSFSEKLPLLQTSNLSLNRDIGAHSKWSAKEINQRTQSLINMALKVFIP